MDRIEELRFLVLAAQRDGSRRLAEALRPLGVTTAQAEVLGVLAERTEPLSVKELGELLVCETGSPSRLARSVVQAGWAELAQDPRDARVTRLRLTSAGRRQAAAIASVEQGFHDAVAAGIDQSQLDSLLEVLRGFVADGPAGRALARRRDGQPGN